MPTMSVMAANALQLAAQQYGDSTGFVQILEANGLNDILINAPISTATLSIAEYGDTKIVIPPTDGIQIGWLANFIGITTTYTVTNVSHNYTVASGMPFCNCIPGRFLPASGTRISTTVSLAPTINQQIVAGQKVIFSCAVPTKLSIPPQPRASKRGIV